MPESGRLAAEVAERRVSLRLTQQTLADLAGVSRSSVQALESGAGSIRVAALLQICDVLGVRLTLSQAG